MSPKYYLSEKNPKPTSKENIINFWLKNNLEIITTPNVAPIIDESPYASIKFNAEKTITTAINGSEIIFEPMETYFMKKELLSIFLNEAENSLSVRGSRTAAGHTAYVFTYSYSSLLDNISFQLNELLSKIANPLEIISFNTLLQFPCNQFGVLQPLETTKEGICALAEAYILFQMEAYEYIRSNNQKGKNKNCS